MTEKLKINKGEKLGWGSEKMVYKDLNNPDRVIGIFKKEKEIESRVKARFYLTKILHLLLPDNIRDIHAVYSDPNVIINSKLKEDSPWKFWKKTKYNTETMREIIFLSTKLAALGVWVDSLYINFMRDKDGNLVYIDSIDPWDTGSRKTNFDFGKLRKGIDGLNEDEKKKGSLYLERLIKLAEEEGVEVRD